MTRLAPLALVTSAYLLAACSLPGSGDPGDSGGNPVAYAAFVATLERERRPFVAPARCSSSCTMLLKPSARDLICFPAHAVLRFHSVTLARSTSPGPEVDGFNRLVAAHYPSRLARWFLEKGPGATRSTAFVEIPVSDLAARGEARVCPRL